MQEKNDYLGTEAIPKLLKKMALPTVVAQLINMLYNMVDRMYIGHIPETGALSLTGVGVCMPIIILVAAFAALISSGGAPLASIAMGKNDNDTAEEVLGNCFALQIVISIILTIVLLLFNKPLLLMFGASENTIPYALEYMNIYALGTIFVQLTLGMNAFATAQGFTNITMKSVIIGAVTNIVLDPIFIFGMNMGVKGAALATIISQAISTIWILNFLIRGKSILKIKKSHFHLNKQLVGRVLSLGSAAFIMQASESVIAICFNASLLEYGGDIAVGAMTILGSVMQLALLPLSGLGQGGQPIISYNFGKENPERVKEAFFLLLKVSLIYSCSLCLFIEVFPQVFISMFSNDAELIAYTIPALRIYCAIIGLFGAQIACQFTFNAIGNAKASIMVAVMRKIILLIPLIYILPNVLSLPKSTSVFLAEPIADILSVLFTIFLFNKEFKKALSSIETSA